jgi:hypothetical protein
MSGDGQGREGMRGAGAGRSAGAPGDPLARIGERLVAAEHGRRRRRRHARQRIVGVAVTVALLVATGVVARPFDGGSHRAASEQRVVLDAGDGRFVTYATGRRSICANRPNGRDRAGASICAPSKLVADLLNGPARTAWVQARVVGDRVIVTGLAAPDARIVVAAPLRRGTGMRPTEESRAGEPTVTVGLLGSPPLVVRPFALSLPRTGAANVSISAPNGFGPTIVQRVPIGATAPGGLGGFAKLTYAVTVAASVAEPAQARLQEMTPLPGHQRAPARVQVLGDGDRLTVWVPGARVDAARAALKPGVLRIYDWEASALLPDGATVASGLASELPRATTVSRTAGASVGLTLSDARRQLRAQPGPARIVQALGPWERGMPLRRDDPRARFFVVRGGPALTGAEGVVVRPIDRSGEVQPQLLFAASQRDALRQVTRAVARRGQSLMLPGASSALVAQHLAVVLDDRVVTLAAIDPQRQPDGVVGSTVAMPDTVVRRGLRELTDSLQLGRLPAMREVS